MDKKRAIFNVGHHFINLSCGHWHMVHFSPLKQPCCLARFHPLTTKTPGDMGIGYALTSFLHVFVVVCMSCIDKVVHRKRHLPELASEGDFCDTVQFQTALLGLDCQLKARLRLLILSSTSPQPHKYELAWTLNSNCFFSSVLPFLWRWRYKRTVRSSTGRLLDVQIMFEQFWNTFWQYRK